jgi:hypothetical protein
MPVYQVVQPLGFVVGDLCRYGEYFCNGMCCNIEAELGLIVICHYMPMYNGIKYWTWSEEASRVI